ncbi:hypothetical protein BDV10DRAFT_185921 [Aspergillus recurvatus]
MLASCASLMRLSVLTLASFVRDGFTEPSTLDACRLGGDKFQQELSKKCGYDIQRHMIRWSQMNGRLMAPEMLYTLETQDVTGSKRPAEDKLPLHRPGKHPRHTSGESGNSLDPDNGRHCHY